MAREYKYIDSTEVEAYLEAGYSVNFCRFYQFDKMCYLAWRDENGLEAGQVIPEIPDIGI